MNSVAAQSDPSVSIQPARPTLILVTPQVLIVNRRVSIRWIPLTRPTNASFVRIQRVLECSERIADKLFAYRGS